MISRVFETKTETRVRKVKKEQTKVLTKTIYETVARSQQVYEPPTGVTNCLHCGRRLHDALWTYTTKSGKYLCPDCWYRRLSSSQIREYHDQAQKMSKGGYSYRTVTENVPRTVSETIKQIVEMDEPYTYEETKLVHPVDIDYPSANQIIKFTVAEPEEIFKMKNDLITDDELNRDYWWYGAQSIQEAYSLREKKSDIQHIKIDDIGSVQYNELIVDEKQVLEEYDDIVGFYPNVPAYIQGHPLNMYNNRRRNVIDIEKTVTIFFNVALDSKYDASVYENKGVIAFNLIKHLMEQDVKVNLKLLDCSYIDGETLVIETLIEHRVIKNDEHSIYEFMTNIAFLRIILAEYKNRLIKDKKISSKWSTGFGYSIKDEQLRKTLDLNDSDILFNDIDRLNILGYFLHDDYLQAMSSLGYLNETLYESKWVDGKEDIREIIQKKQISKLIHVTSSDNVDSIKQHGLLPIQTLDEKQIDCQRNDYKRLDGHKDAVCLSVENPNIYLFNKFTRMKPYMKFTIIEIDPRILFELPYKKIFSDYNAASRMSKKSETSMSIMYQEVIIRKSKPHTREGKKDAEPTSNQAEILFCGTIHPKYFLKMYDYVVKEHS